MKDTRFNIYNPSLFREAGSHNTSYRNIYILFRFTRYHYDHRQSLRYITRPLLCDLTRGSTPIYTPRSRPYDPMTRSSRHTVSRDPRHIWKCSLHRVRPRMFGGRLLKSLGLLIWKLPCLIVLIVLSICYCVLFDTADKLILLFATILRGDSTLN